MREGAFNSISEVAVRLPRRYSVMMLAVSAMIAMGKAATAKTIVSESTQATRAVISAGIQRRENVATKVS